MVPADPVAIVMRKFVVVIVVTLTLQQVKQDHEVSIKRQRSVRDK